MLLGIAGHSVAEGRARHGHRTSVHEDALVEAVDLFLQFDGVAVSTLFGYEARLVLGLVAAEHQQVGDAQKLQVEQHVFGIFARESAAQQMGHGGQSVFVLDGSCHGHGARSAAEPLALVEPVAQFLVHVFAPMGGDVDIFGVKFAQRVYGGIQPFDACPLEWGQHFEGEGRMLVAVDQFYDVHCLFSLFQLFRAHIGAYWDKNSKRRAHRQMKTKIFIGLCRAGLGTSGKHTTFCLETSNVFLRNIQCFPLKHCLISSLCKSDKKIPLPSSLSERPGKGMYMCDLGPFTSMRPALP